MENIPTRPDATYLRAYFKKWKISIPIIAASISMPESTFKNKLRENAPQYNFTLMEYMAVLRALLVMASEAVTLHENDPVFDNDFTRAQKSKILS